MKIPTVRTLFSFPAAIFYSLASLSIHESLNFPDGTPAALALLAQWLLSSSVALWILADARRRGSSLPYDTGTLFFIAWPVAAPVYLFSTRGWRAFPVLLRFILLNLAAAFFLTFLDLLHSLFR